MPLAQLLKGWNFVRFLRLGIGLVVGYNGLIAQDYLLIFLGGLLIFQAAINSGCGFGPNSSCEIKPSSKINKNELPGAD